MKETNVTKNETEPERTYGISGFLFVRHREET